MNHKNFIESKSENISYRNFYHFVISIIDYLKSQKLSSSDTIAFYASPSPLAIGLIFACQYLSIKIIFLNIKTPCLELIKNYHILSKKRINILLIEKDLKIEKEFFNHTEKILSVFELDQRFKQKKHAIKINFLFIFKIRYRYFLNKNHPLTLLYTSGTTGKPKIIPLSWNNHLHNAIASNKNLNYTSRDKWLLHLPLYHVSGLSIIFRTFFAKATLYLSHSEDWIQTIKENQTITHASFVSTQIEQLTEKKLHPVLKKFKAILIGGSIITENIWKKIKAGYPFYPTYGMTENASQIATYQKGMPLYHYKLLRHTKAKIINNNIYIKGKCLFGKKNLWFLTKDRGELNKGILSVNGRIDNMFISGGENIQPEEIEQILMSTSLIRIAVIVPEKNSKWGEIPIAYVHPYPDEKQQQELNDVLRKKLPKYKIPKRYSKFPQKTIEDFSKNLKISRNFMI